MDLSHYQEVAALICLGLARQVKPELRTEVALDLLLRIETDSLSGLREVSDAYRDPSSRPDQP